MKRVLSALLSLLIAYPCYANIPVPAGSTSNVIQCQDVSVRDSSISSAWTGLGGLTNATAGLTCYYHRDAASSNTAMSLASMTLGTWTSNGFKEIDATHALGNYQLCLPNAAVATGANAVSVHCEGATNMEPMNLRVSLMSPNTFGYDGQLSSKSGTALTLATGAVAADGAYIYQNEVVFVTGGGLVKANSCIVASVASTSVVTTAEDISALISNNDNYFIRPNAGCRNLRPATAGRTLLVDSGGHAAPDWASVGTPGATVNLSGTTIGAVTGAVGSVTGNVGGIVTGSVGSVVGNVNGNLGGNVIGNVNGSVNSVVGSVASVVGNVNGNLGGNVIGNVNGSTNSVVGNVGGNVNGNVVGSVGSVASGGLTGTSVAASFLAKFFNTNSGQSFGTSVSGSVVNEIASNCSGGSSSSSSGGTCTTIAPGAITAASYGPDAIGSVKTAQSATLTEVVGNASDNYPNGDFARGTGVLITSATTGAWQYRCVCQNSSVTKKLILCKPFQTVPTGTIKYALIPDASCNGSN